jgi:hypothetical protein
MAEAHFDMPAVAGIRRELQAGPFVRDSTSTAEPPKPRCAPNMRSASS